MKPRYALVVALLVVACSSIQPAKVQVGDRCYSCRQPIQDLKIAAAMIDQTGGQYPFRSPRCLARYLHDHPADKSLPFVTDYKSGYMLEADKAWFVSVALPSPDGHGTEPNFLAFRNVRDAERANTTNAPLQRWSSLVSSAN